MKKTCAVILSAILIFCFNAQSAQQDQEKKQIEWDLTDLFKNEKEWTKSLKAVEKELSALQACKGKLTSSSGRLHHCLEKMFSVDKEITRSYIWASLQQSTDLKNEKFSGNIDKVRNLAAKVSEASSFYRPELIEAGKEKITELTKNKKEFADYSQYLTDVIREAEHTLSPKEEALLSAYSPVIGNTMKIRNFLYTADIEWGKVKLDDGKEIVVDDNGYSEYRASNNRNDRLKVFDSFYTTLKKYERTFGATLAQQVQTHVISAKRRNYKNALSQALGGDNLPEEVYRQLVKQVNKGLPTLHRYLKIRGKLLGVKDLAYYDIYPDLIKSDKKYPLKTSREILISGVKPLGEDYVHKISEATTAKWMHVYPQKGKQGGAYMSGNAYDVHPFIFLNHRDDFDTAMTYAHEWGHAMHSVLANESQPYPKADYPTFTAEIASTTNEALVMKDILSKTTDPEERLFFLGHELEQIRGTFFRQTQFGEFELAIHEVIEKGEPLTGEKISQIYGDILKRYYGHDKKVMKIDPKYNLEWAFVPHFYYNFYVYQYATSMSAGYYFADRILKGEKGAQEKYLGLLQAGGSKYPYELLKEAGLDMAKPDAYKAIIQRADDIMDEMETLLKKRK